jgi:hypothetical protein
MESAMNPTRRTIVLAIVWIAAYFAARAFLEGGALPAWQRVTVAVLPVPIFAALLLSYLGMFRTMDELERRIHLEALAIAFSLGVLLLTTLALLQRAVALPFEDWSYAHVWYFLPIFYFSAVGLVAGRYHRDAE